MNHRNVAAALCLALLAATPSAQALDVKRLGDIGAVGLPAGALVVAIAHKDGKGALELAGSYAAAEGLAYLLKRVVHRTRPDGSTDDSFPSGHTASAFVGATFLAKRYGPGWGLGAYPLAAFVGWTRVYGSRHFPSDVAVGAALGIGATVVLTRERKQIGITWRWR